MPVTQWQDNPTTYNFLQFDDTVAAFEADFEFSFESILAFENPDQPGHMVVVTIANREVFMLAPNDWLGLVDGRYEVYPNDQMVSSEGMFRPKPVDPSE